MKTNQKRYTAEIKNCNHIRLYISVLILSMLSVGVANRTKLIISTLILLMLSIGVAGAEESSAVNEAQVQQENSRGRYTIFGLPLLSSDETLDIGLGVGFSTSPFKGVDDQIDFLPEFSYQNGNFFIDTSVIGYSLFSGENYEFAILGSWRLPEYDRGDSSYLKGMKKRNFVIEGGAAFTVETSLGEFGIAAMSDITNNHKGHVVTAEYSLPIGDDSWVIQPVAGVRWQSENMVGYYYGVRSSEVRDDRAAYNGKSALIPFLALNFAMEIYDNFFIQGGISYESLGSGITDSPLIDENDVLSGSLSLNYSF